MDFITLLIDNDDKNGLKIEHARIQARIYDNNNLLNEIEDERIKMSLKDQILEDKKILKLVENYLSYNY